jgi:hypothetical protein
MDSEPHLCAVVECPIEAPAFVAPVRPRPWPGFIQLSGASPDQDVALVVAQLARYGHGAGGPTTIESLAADFPHVTPGGLAAVDRLTTVLPSCCCGLESWRDWYRLLSEGQSPWLGHDPSPWVEMRGEEFLVWPDGGLGDAGVGEFQPIRFSKLGLAASLANAEADLGAFAGAYGIGRRLLRPRMRMLLPMGFAGWPNCLNGANWSASELSAWTVRHSVRESHAGTANGAFAPPRAPIENVGDPAIATTGPGTSSHSALSSQGTSYFSQNGCEPRERLIPGPGLPGHRDAFESASIQDSG